jgi:hypothetical protein
MLVRADARLDRVEVLLVGTLLAPALFFDTDPAGLSRCFYSCGTSTALTWYFQGCTLTWLPLDGFLN